MSRYYIAHLDRRHMPTFAGPFLTKGSAREYLEAVAIEPGVILRREGHDLLPVMTLRGDGTEIRHEPGQ